VSKRTSSEGERKSGKYCKPSGCRPFPSFAISHYTSSLVRAV
jgi:hypothetical protein